MWKFFEFLQKVEFTRGHQRETNPYQDVIQEHV
jgi:hypothetical protein